MRSIAKTPKNEAVRGAVHRHDHLSKDGILERAFTFAFRGLVYAQIWEDPVVDMEALAITRDSHVMTIASGGCNMMSYLTADPARITVVDLNPAHIALNKMKLVAAKHLPDQAAFHRFFADADWADNLDLYRTHIAPNLDADSRAYWEGRDILGRKRIGGFAKGFYRRGLLGNFIALAHFLAKLYGVDPREILAARDMAEQQRIFDTRLKTVFDKRFIRWLVDQPASLFGLGIPPAQYESLASDDPQGIRAVLIERLRKLACDFPLKDNYFAWQAFNRGYEKTPDASVPPYLEAANFDTVRARADRVDVRHINMVHFLESQGAGSLDRYILLDAQDWMTDEQLTKLWSEITRTAKPGARVLFRTAAAPSLLPGRIPDVLLDQWDYRAEESLDYTRRDRSAIYGGVHLYVLKA
ncbi:DUF3419 family protein [Sphingomonas sp. FW199]|uniref:DUF3419 family protein n=1 Tax=Sphingomonas sp. FW199 TaxID=3400217 RepID=UPI003CEDE390